MSPAIVRKGRMLAAVATCIFFRLASFVHADVSGLFTYTVIGGSTIEITDYPTGEIGAVIVPEEIDGKPVTRVGDYAFYLCSSLTSITLPSGVTSVGFAAFRFCSSLTNMTLPSSITIVGGSAFKNCSSLTSIILPPGLTSIGEGAFYDCRKLTSITLPAGLTSVASSTFLGCSSLTSITLPTGVTSVGAYAFEGCSSLTSISLPPGLTSVGHAAFGFCSSLASVTLPSSVTIVGGYAFQNCSNMSEAYFLGDAPALGANVFLNTAPGFLIYYLSGSSGFTMAPWDSFLTVCINESSYPAASWLLTHGYDYMTDPEQDLNGDGVELLMAYALNLNPHENLAGQMPQAVVTAGSMSMTYYCASAGVIYQVEACNDLTIWSTAGVTTSGPDVDGMCTASRAKDGPAGYMRLRVVEDTPSL